MYNALGNKKAQQAIRAENPNAKHCNKLEISSKACNGCPNNPHQGSKAKILGALEEHSEIIELAYRLYGDWELGLLDKEAIMSMAPYEVVCLRIIKGYEDEVKEMKKLTFLKQALIGK